jgi:hypothetical protein
MRSPEGASHGSLDSCWEALRRRMQTRHGPSLSCTRRSACASGQKPTAIRAFTGASGSIHFVIRSLPILTPSSRRHGRPPRSSTVPTSTTGSSPATAISGRSSKHPSGSPRRTPSRRCSRSAQRHDTSWPRGAFARSQRSRTVTHPGTPGCGGSRPSPSPLDGSPPRNRSCGSSRPDP